MLSLSSVYLFKYLWKYLHITLFCGLFILLVKLFQLWPLRVLSSWLWSVVVQSLRCVQLFVTSGTAALRASLSSTISQSLLKFMSIESVMLSNHLTLCHPLLFLPSIFASIRAFSSELALHIKWPEYWSFSFSISPSNEYSGLILLGLTGLISLSPVLKQGKGWNADVFRESRNDVFTVLGVYRFRGGRLVVGSEQV